MGDMAAGDEAKGSFMGVADIDPGQGQRGGTVANSLADRSEANGLRLSPERGEVERS